MSVFRRRKYSLTSQYLIASILVGITSVGCFFSVDVIGYQVVALILLLLVSILAMLFDILPVLVAALLSALIWNFFFIPPILTLHIGTPQDSLMFLMYFVVAMINAVLTFKIRESERLERDRTEKEKSLQLYNTLLNSLSHELRTPISTIIGAVDTITENGEKLTKKTLDELHSEIAIAGFRLNGQVENLLGMSRLEAGVLRPKWDWCDVNELIFSVIQTNREAAQGHTILFEPDENLPLFRLDGGIMEQVLHNILQNALQHTPPTTTITISAWHSEGLCHIRISDTGKGFPEEEIGLVFDKFYRLDGSRTGGTGLGLSIAKGFTEALGGTIALANGPEGGAVFTISVPTAISTINDLEDEQSGDIDH
ncbi:MAG: ATP-binding protein [Sediminicola sp.]|tara:strand:- start:23504 stop:24607 length:1104 start_codon:yes stop_codon:yes gene_type:complete